MPPRALRGFRSLTLTKRQPLRKVPHQVRGSVANARELIAEYSRV
jgi:hypothetical protein